MSHENKSMCICSTIPLSIEAFYGKQLDFLKKNGFRITVISSPDSAFSRALSQGIRYFPVKMVRSVSPFNDFLALLRIIMFFSRNEFSIVQYNTPKAALLCSIAAWVTRVPTRLYLMWGLYYTGQHGFKRRFYKAIDKIICRISTNIAPDGYETREFAIKEKLCPSSKIEVIGNGSANGIDLERFSPEVYEPKRLVLRKELGISDSDVVIGTVARLSAEKGINELVEAFVEVQNENPSLKLLLVGPYEQNSGLLPEVMRNIGNHNSIVATGFQRHVESYLSMMDIFVLPSWREGFGVVNLEAAAMELPVISSDVMGPRESVLDGKTGILVPLRDVEALKRAILRLADDPNLCRKFGEAGRLRVETEFEQKMHWKYILEHRHRIMKIQGF